MQIFENAMEVVCIKKRDPEDKFCWNIEKDMKKCKHFIESIESKPLMQNEPDDIGE